MDCCPILNLYGCGLCKSVFPSQDIHCNHPCRGRILQVKRAKIKFNTAVSFLACSSCGISEIIQSEPAEEQNQLTADLNMLQKHCCSHLLIVKIWTMDAKVNQTDEKWKTEFGIRRGGDNVSLPKEHCGCHFDEASGFKQHLLGHLTDNGKMAAFLQSLECHIKITASQLLSQESLMAAVKLKMPVSGNQFQFSENIADLMGRLNLYVVDLHIPLDPIDVEEKKVAFEFALVRPQGPAPTSILKSLRTYVCNKCGAICVGDSVATAHSRLCNLADLREPPDGFLNTQFRILLHENSLSNAPVQCLLCSYGACSLDGYKTHMLVQHNQNVDILEWPIPQPSVPLVDDIDDVEIVEAPSSSTVVCNAVQDDDDYIQIVEILGGTRTTTSGRAKNHKCHLCSATFYTQGSLKAHEKYAHIGDISGQMDMCSEDYGIPLVGQMHLCLMCCAAFEDPEKYSRHMKVHLEKNPNNLICDLCCGINLCKKDFEMHKTKHTDKLLRYRCIRCDPNIIFQEENAYLLHVQQAHQMSILFFCKKCFLSSCKLEPILSHVMNGRCSAVYDISPGIGFFLATQVNFQPVNESAYKAAVNLNPTSYVMPSLCSHKTAVRFGDSFTSCTDDKCGLQCMGLVQYRQFENVVRYRLSTEQQDRVAFMNDLPKELLPSSVQADPEHNFHNWLNNYYLYDPPGLPSRGTVPVVLQTAKDRPTTSTTIAIGEGRLTAGAEMRSGIQAQQIARQQPGMPNPMTPMGFPMVAPQPQSPFVTAQNHPMPPVPNPPAFSAFPNPMATFNHQQPNTRVDIRRFHNSMDLQHMCALCKEMFSSVEGVFNHLISEHYYHIEKVRYDLKCPWCTVKEDEPKKFHSHVETKHGSIVNSRSVLCPSSLNFASTAAQRAHDDFHRTANASNTGCCCFCGAPNAFDPKKVNEIRIPKVDHVVIYHSMKINYTCRMCCFYEVPTKAALHQHLQQVHRIQSTDMDQQTMYQYNLAVIPEDRALVVVVDENLLKSFLGVV